jgi:hypothetical protein
MEDEKLYTLADIKKAFFAGLRRGSSRAIVYDAEEAFEYYLNPPPKVEKVSIWKQLRWWWAR